MDIVSYDARSQLDALENVWEELSEQEVQFVPSFLELCGAVGKKFQILVAIENKQAKAVACFVYRDTRKEYEIATRKLFSLPLKEVSLFGSCVLGQPDQPVIRRFLQLIIKEGGFDIINLGDIFTESSLYKAAGSLRGVVAWTAARKKRQWWLTRLPRSFNEYIASLPASSRSHITRDCRKCEREVSAFRVMCNPAEIGIFLRDAESISRTSYQWELDYGVRNDERTQRQFSWLANNGILRSYILDVHGTPAAFGWGKLCHNTFVFVQTGYNPQFRKLSPGTALIMRMFQDLIENTDCEYFDFLWGGDDGYKARLGNIRMTCVPIQLAEIYRPYPMLILVLDQALNSIKKALGAILEHRVVKQRLRTLMRRYGIGTF
jgi:GNAT acetyltransferase-like protein